MSKLLALSFDAAASPAITLGGDGEGPARGKRATGWGFAWYPASDTAAVVIKDPVHSGDTAMTSVLRDWDRFHGAVFVCHLRGAAKRVTQEDTHPFQRSYGGRDWVLAHNGDLDPVRVRELSLGDNPVFEPVGRTDSEHAFCWLLTQIRGHGARRISGVPFPELRAWLQQLDELGTLNLLMSDGLDLIAYRDTDAGGPLYYSRRVPPHASGMLESDTLQIDLGNPLDRHRSYVVVSSSPLGEGFVELQPGQMIVVRRGVLTWDSTGEADNRPFRSGPAPTVAAEPEVAPEVSPDVAHPAAAVQPRTELPTTTAERLPPKTLRRSKWRTLRVTHESIYTYQEAVEHSQHALRLRPTVDVHQQVESFELVIEPAGERRDYEDVFGNQVTQLVQGKPYERFRTRAVSTVRLREPSTRHAPVRRMTIPLVWMPWQRQMMSPYLLPSELPETELHELSEFAMSFVERQDYDLLETLVDMNRTIYRDFEYVPGFTTLATTPFDVYVHRRGVCQDFANLFICLARLLGVPARYRVGYIYTGASYENQIQSEASHAWVEVYLPWVGWRGFDPTNGCLAGLDHVRVACGRNYRDATPTAGTIYKGGLGERLQVRVKVEPVD